MTENKKTSNTNVSVWMKNDRVFVNYKILPETSYTSDRLVFQDKNTLDIYVVNWIVQTAIVHGEDL